MKILIVTQYFWPEPFRTNEVATALHQLGHTVEVITGQPNYPEGKIYEGYSASSSVWESHNGINILRVPQLPRGENSSLRLVLNYISFALSSCLVGSVRLRKRRYDVILGFGLSPIYQVIFGILIAKTRKIPFVLWVQDLWPESLRITGRNLPETLTELIRTTVSLIYRSSSVVLVQSQAFISPVKALAGDNTPVRYHPNPGDIASSRGAPELMSTPPFQLSNGFNIVFAGNLGHAQALDDVVEAARILKAYSDIHFYLVGGGSFLPEMKKRKKSYSLTNLHLPGRFQPDCIPSILSQASVLLVSMKSDSVISLTVPSKIPTYMSQRKPILAYLDGEGADIIAKSNSGYVCSPKSPRLLADTILNMRNMNESELAQLGRNAYSYYCKNFDPLMLSRKLEQHLSSAC